MITFQLEQYPMTLTWEFKMVLTYLHHKIYLKKKAKNKIQDLENFYQQKVYKEVFKENEKYYTVTFQ